MVNKILRSKLKNHVDKLLEMTEFAVSMEAYTYVKDKHFSSIQPWNIEYLWLATPVWMDLMKLMYLSVPNRIQKKITSYLTKKSTSYILLTHWFESFSACLTTLTWNGWINLLLLWIPNHMQKTNFVTHYLSCPGVPDHNLLKWSAIFVLSMDV